MAQTVTSPPARQETPNKIDKTPCFAEGGGGELTSPNVDFQIKEPALCLLQWKHRRHFPAPSLLPISPRRPVSCFRIVAWNPCPPVAPASIQVKPAQ